MLEQSFRLVRPALLLCMYGSPVQVSQQIKPVYFTQAQLLVCIGTSLEVYPFAGLADNFPYGRPRILINRDLVGSFGYRDHDYHIGGDLVEGITKLADGLGWKKELSKYLS